MIKLALIVSLWVSLAAAAEIKVCVQKYEGGETSALPHANVQCFDEDYDWDDQMTDVVQTGSDGCALLTYSKKSPKWWNPCKAWDCPGWTNPDIYCSIEKAGVIAPHTTATKNNHNQNDRANFLSETVYAERSCGAGENGCGSFTWPSTLNDLISWVTGFGDQCDNHDCCYSDCDETQATCDLAFLGEMESKCHDSHDTDAGKATCLYVASLMYGAVDSFGQSSFDADRDHC